MKNAATCISQEEPTTTHSKLNTKHTDTHMADSSGSLPAVPPPPPSSPRDDDEATAWLLALAILVLVACVAAALCLRVRRTWHNRKERRRLTKRVAWLRDLLQLLPPAPLPSPAEEELEKGSAGGSARAAAGAVRTVLARRIEATVSEVDRLVASASMSMSYCGCCLLGFARSYDVARRLERANRDVDEVYSHLLPVVTQIDAAHRVEQVLVGVMQQQQQQLRDKNNHRSDAHRAAAQTRPNGSNEFDWKPLLSENNDDQASTGTTTFGITVDR